TGRRREPGTGAARFSERRCARQTLLLRPDSDGDHGRRRERYRQLRPGRPAAPRGVLVLPADQRGRNGLPDARPRLPRRPVVDGAGRAPSHPLRRPGRRRRGRPTHDPFNRPQRRRAALRAIKWVMGWTSATAAPGSTEWMAWRTAGAINDGSPRETRTSIGKTVSSALVCG